MEELHKPVEELKAGGQDVDGSFPRAFAQGAEEDMDTESILADLVAGMPELREETEQQEKSDRSPSPLRIQEKPQPQTANGSQRQIRHEVSASNGISQKTHHRIGPATNELRKIGRYIIEQEIGKGASGSVFRARDPKLDRTIAIKTVRYRLDQPGADIIALKEKLYQEARALAKLNHPNIVVVHDVDEDHDLCFIVMEYLDGTDLRTLLDKEHRLEWERAVQLMIQACSAVHYAHSVGVVHLDIKPGNLVLQHHHGNLKVTDFSIDKSNQKPAASNNSESGTHHYLSPEQRNGGSVDCRSDVFSLGVVFYELLTGETPCVDENIELPARSITEKSYVPPSLQNIELPVEVDEVVAGALSVDPQERYPTADKFRETLVRLQTSVLLL